MRKDSTIIHSLNCSTRHCALSVGRIPPVDWARNSETFEDFHNLFLERNLTLLFVILTIEFTGISGMLTFERPSEQYA